MKTIIVGLGDRSYPIHIGSEALQVLPEILDTIGAKSVIGVVSDTGVAPLYGDRIVRMVEDSGRRAIPCVFESGESKKRLTHVESLIGQFLEAGAVAILFGYSHRVHRVFPAGCGAMHPPYSRRARNGTIAASDQVG